jgi:hypothetical protein
MTLKLIRRECKDTGIFSDLCAENGVKLYSTLEHSYDCKPKIPNGTFTCVRGKHRLHGMTEDFETFEITGVEGHQGLLFHCGNFNKDSEGCVLVGRTRSGDMVTSSREAFADFMEGLKGLDSFTLIVS